MALVVGTTGDPRPAAAAPLSLPADVRTYEFTARVKDNGGVTPLQVGAAVRGTVCYDLRGEDLDSDNKRCGRYASPRNSLSARIGDLEFRAAGDVSATTGAF